VDILAPTIAARVVDIPIISKANGGPDIHIVASNICEKKTRENISKPRTAFFKGEEDDEPMVHQNISAGISLDPYKELIISSGINLLKKFEEKQERKLNTVQPGSMLLTEPT